MVSSSRGRQLYMEEFAEELTIVGAVEQINSSIPSLALAPKASNLFYVSSANNGVVGGVCE